MASPEKQKQVKTVARTGHRDKNTSYGRFIKLK